MKQPSAARFAIITIAIVAAALFSSGCTDRPEWSVTDDGFLKYKKPVPDYHSGALEESENCTLCEVTFESRGADIEGLIRIPRTNRTVPGIVLLPGATVTKEAEQGLARYLCDLGYASIAIDQRNLGGIDMEGDLRMFLSGVEPVEHKMVYDAISAAAVLRAQPEIDSERIVYLGESNGGRFAIIACALDSGARGVVAISTCGYGIDAVVASGRITDPDAIRFYRSVDPDTYLNEIGPRKFVMIHSINDPIIPYESAQQTYMKIGGRKSLHTIDGAGHGYNSGMNPFLEAELGEIFI